MHLECGTDLATVPPILGIAVPRPGLVISSLVSLHVGDFGNTQVSQAFRRSFPISLAGLSLTVTLRAAIEAVFQRGTRWRHYRRTAELSLIATGNDRTVLIWDLKDFDNLEGLLTRGCAWVQDYLRTNPRLGDSDRQLCRQLTVDAVPSPAPAR